MPRNWYSRNQLWNCTHFRQPTDKQLRLKERDLRALGIDINARRGNLGFRTFCMLEGRQSVQQGLSEFEDTLAEQAETKRQTRKARNQGDKQATDHICSLCGRDCHSRIGLSSQTRRCSKTTNQSATPYSLFRD